MLHEYVHSLLCSPAPGGFVVWWESSFTLQQLYQQYLGCLISLWFPSNGFRVAMKFGVDVKLLNSLVFL